MSEKKHRPDFDLPAKVNLASELKGAATPAVHSSNFAEDHAEAKEKAEDPLLDKQSYGQIAVEAAKVIAAEKLGPLAPPAIDLLTRFGGELLSAGLGGSGAASAALLERLKREKIDGSKAPAVIGLGRCGCRVTASLAQMISQARGAADGRHGNSSRQMVPRWLSDLLKSKTDKQAYTLDPILVVGDLNINTFTEIKGLIEHGGSSVFADTLLILDYSPVAADGAGNIPVFGEYFTRALLSLSPDWKGSNPEWNLARSYLIGSFERSASSPKLAFYIFGAAGGSGSGGAMELHRAQRTALALTPGQPPRIYFSGIAVIPSDIDKNDHQLRNTGRLLVQYLADLDIRLEDDSDYIREVQPRYATRAQACYNASNGNEQKRVPIDIPIPPWDSLGIVSNQIMCAVGATSDRQPAVEERANQYIAQQIFNLAYSQSAADAYKTRHDTELDPTTRFQAVKLDVEDLINGLCGPYAIGFSASEADAVASDSGVDSFYLRAISVPAIYTSKVNTALNNTIQGISICPQRQEKYSATVAKIRDKINEEKPGSSSLSESDFKSVRELLFFARCPRLVVVLTSPVNDHVTSGIQNRIKQLIEWCFPIVRQVRMATIAGTTPFYSLSLYIEGSVVHAYDVKAAIANYLFSCWKNRSNDPMAAQQFADQFKAIIDQRTPISTQQVVDWLGPVELYGDNVNAWAKRVDDHEASWRKHVSGLRDLPDSRRPQLRKHSVESCLLTPEHLAAALRYLNYARHTGRVAPVPVFDE